jgi:serine/threonine-protein kinase
MIMRLEKIVVVAAVVLALSALVLFAIDAVVMPLVVQAGRNVRVPDLVEFAQARAESLLAANGFVLVVDGAENNQNVGAGAVISQNPAAYAVTKPGRRIHVVISKGARYVTMPDVTGISLRQAEMSLKELGLERGSIYKMYSAQIPPDVVMKQSVAPQAQVPAGKQVDLTVSAQ